MGYLVTNCTFNGVAFLLSADGLSDSVEALTSEEVVPFGTYRVVQLGGRGVRTLSGTAYFDQQLTLDNFQAYAGTEAALTMDWTTLSPRQAVLKSVKQGGDSGDTPVRSADVTFLLAETT